MTSVQTSPARKRRPAVLREIRRSQLVETAKSVFKAVGLERASMRIIAAEAGCTTGAIYPYFRGKEELYAAVLATTLDALREEVVEAVRHPEPEAAAKAGLWAVFNYYRAHPDDLTLGLYLFGGEQPAGLSSELNRSLNSQLREIFDLVEDCFQRTADTDPAGKTASGIAQATGLLILEKTGRLRLLKKEAAELFSQHLKGL